MTFRLSDKGPREGAYGAAMMADMCTQMTNLTCDYWGLVRPKVHVTWEARKRCYLVHLVWNMKWEWNWFVEDGLDSKVMAGLFGEFGYQWVRDANVPITGELECNQHLMSVS